MEESIELIGYKSFVTSIQPFDKLKEDAITRITSTIDIIYFKENETILKAGDIPKLFYIIVKGHIQEIDPEDTEVNHMSTKDFFDPASLIGNQVKNTFKCIEETICFVFPKEVFLHILNFDNDFKNFFLQDISHRIHMVITKNVNKELSSFMIKRVNQSHIRKAVVVDKNTSIYDAAKAMSANKSSCVLIEEENKPSAIVTDNDLRNKVILKKMSYDTNIQEIASNSLITIEEDDFLFNGMLTMIEHSIKRLVVTKNGKIRGILEQVDLLGTISHKTHLIDVRIRKAHSIEELQTITQDMIYLIKTLMATGVKISNIQKLLGELNIKLYRKLYELIAPPELIENSCLIVLGSEGRKEQVLKTDQDNALILRDDYYNKDFRKICDKFTAALLTFGYPECPGNVMVNNPYWAKSLKEFKKECLNWVTEPDPDDLMNLSILLDARTVSGDPALLEDLKSLLIAEMQKNRVLISRFSKPTIMFETPLSLFFGFIVEKKEHKSELDLKRGGLFPIIHGIRSLALENEIKETNTIKRIEILKEKGLLSKELGEELIQAFDFLNTLRASERLRQQDKAKTIDNYINPYKLSKIERDVLKDVFKIVDKFKKIITLHFKLDMIK